MEDRIDYFERMLADNPDNPTGLLALANEYQKAGREEEEAAVLQRYLASRPTTRETPTHAWATCSPTWDEQTRRVPPTRRASPSRRSMATAVWPTTSGSP